MHVTILGFPLKLPLCSFCVADSTCSCRVGTPEGRGWVALPPAYAGQSQTAACLPMGSSAEGPGCGGRLHSLEAVTPVSQAGTAVGLTLQTETHEVALLALLICACAALCPGLDLACLLLLRGLCPAGDRLASSRDGQWLPGHGD